jgi:hypothetical protein
MMIASKLKLTNIAAFLLFFYFLACQQPLVWIVKGLSYVTIALAFFGFVFVSNFLGLKIFFKESKNHILVLLLLFIYLVIGYGDVNNLFSQISIYFVALAFFYIGLVYGYMDKFKLLKKIFVATYIISLLNITPYVFYCLVKGKVEKNAILDVYGGDIYAYIMFWPYFLILLTIGFAFTYTNIFSEKTTFLKKYFFVGLFIILVMSIVLSSFTAVLMMMFIIFLVFLTSILAKDKAYKAVLLIPFMFAVLYFAIFFLSQSDGIVSDETNMKLKAIIELGNDEVETYNEEDLDQATGFRWQRIEYALDAFIASPLVGEGFYKYKDNVRITSNHSSIFDGFAKFGLLFLLFINLYISNIRKTLLLYYKTTIKEKKVFVSIILGASVSYFVISFFNPYLEFSTINILFLLFGWVRGQLNTLQTSRNESTLD